MSPAVDRPLAIVVGSGRSWPSCGSFSQEAASGIVLLRAPPALLPAPELLLDPPRDHRCGPVEGGDVALVRLLHVQRRSLRNPHVDGAPDVEPPLRAVDIGERDMDVDGARADAGQRSAEPLSDMASEGRRDCEPGDVDQWN